MLERILRLRVENLREDELRLFEGSKRSAKLGAGDVRDPAARTLAACASQAGPRRADRPRCQGLDLCGPTHHPSISEEEE